MRASRLLSILLMLQTRGRLTADALAATFEVSVRTVYRDIEQLSAAGVPVYADRGPGGGFQLLDGFRTKLTGLTEHEAETLFLSGLPGPATQLGLADQLLSAQLKLTRRPARAQPRRRAARSRSASISIRSTGSRAPIRRACCRLWRMRCGPRPRIEIAYRRGREHGDAAPQSARPRAQGRHLVRRRRASAAAAHLSRLQHPDARRHRATDSRRPKDFDLVRFWTESSAPSRSGSIASEAVLRASPRACGASSAWAPPWPRRPARLAEPPDNDGWVQVTMPIESIEQAAIDLLHLGTEAEVLKPRGAPPPPGRHRGEMAKIADAAARAARTNATTWAVWPNRILRCSSVLMPGFGRSSRPTALPFTTAGRSPTDFSNQRWRLGKSSSFWPKFLKPTTHGQLAMSAIE